MDNTGTWAKDAAERIIFTVLQVVVAAGLTALTSSIASAMSDGSVTLDDLRAIVFVTYAAAAAALKAWVANLFGGTISPASFAKAS
jgi:hypothetical protein